MSFRVAFPSSSPVSSYEPTKILLAPEYIFLESIYSTLVEFSPNGEIIPGVAKDFAWTDGALRLEIRNDLKVEDGMPITIDDVIFSLKRVMLLSGNTHGNLVDLLCDGKSPKTADETCTGIASEGNFLILRPKIASPFLLPMLTGMDFAILPRRAVDPKTLAIRDYSLTSGPYFVEEDRGGGHIRLRLNRNHYHAKSSLADSIELIPTVTADPRESLTKFENGEVDVLTTIDKARSDEVLAFAKDRSDSTLHSTLRIRIMMARFTDQGAGRLSLLQRAYLGSLVRKALLPYFLDKPGFEAADQLFPPMSDAGLSDEQSALAWKALKEAAPVDLPKDLVIATVRVGDVGPIAERIHKFLPGIKIYDPKVHPNLIKAGLMPDLLIAGPDMAYLEDISLLSYAISTRSLGISGVSGRAWLKKYMETEDKMERLKILRDLHFNAVSDAQTIPIASAPYVALTRKPWKPSLSMLFANNPLWQIEQQ